MIKLFVLVVASLFVSTVSAQKLRVESYSIGYRVVEAGVPGGNPLTIAPLMIDENSYTSFVGAFDHNGLTGSPQVQWQHSFYFNTEWTGDEKMSRFWRRHTINFGLFGTGNRSLNSGQLLRRTYAASPGQGYTEVSYEPSRVQQFFGVITGVNRTFPISSKLDFVSSFQIQGGWSLVHFYRQRIDTFVVTPPTSSFSSRRLPDELKGKRYFQWQATVPLGLGYHIFQDLLTLKAEINVNLGGGPYYQGFYKRRLSAGGGIWLIYHPGRTAPRRG